MRAVIGRTHRPCGACAELVDVTEGCPHLPVGRPPSSRSRRAAERADRVAARMVARSELLGALGYPRP
jgi:hypothetical protein